jgi:hypothetical protein
VSSDEKPVVEVDQALHVKNAVHAYVLLLDGSPALNSLGWDVTGPARAKLL